MNFHLIKTLLVTGMVYLVTCTIAHAQTITVNTAQDLAAGRAKIDSLDNLLMKTLGERERIVKEIGIYKAKNHIPPLAAARFQQVLDKSIAAGSKEGLSAGFITEFMNAIHKESLRIEGDIAAAKQ